MAKTYEPTRTFALYGGKIIIDFYDRYGRYTHVYIRRDNGEWLKSVTGATGILNKPLLIPWACKEMEKSLLETFKEKGNLTNKDIAFSKNAWRIKRDKSAELGTIIHELASEYIKYKLGVNKTMPKIPVIKSSPEMNKEEAKEKTEQIKNAYLAFRDWEREHNVKFVSTEQLVYSKKYNFVGTLDCIAMIDGEYCLIDFKSGNGIYGEMIYQVSGYGIASEEETKKKFDRAWIIKFGKETAEFTAKSFILKPNLNKAFLSCLYLKTLQKDVEALVK